MTSIGNDIVDLNAIDKDRTRQKAFYSKILSDSEQQLHSRQALVNPLPFEIFVWLLWSAKESVYKFAKRLDADLVFSPPRIVIQDEPVFSGLYDFRQEAAGAGFANNSTINLTAVHQDKTYYTRSFIGDHFIGTFAGDTPELENISWGIKQINSSDDQEQSDSVRNFLLKKLGTTIPEQQLSISKSPIGYPIVMSGSEVLNIAFSFAHHGHYVAYAMVE